MLDPQRGDLSTDGSSDFAHEWFATPCRLEDAVRVFHPVVGCVDTQNWVLALDCADWMRCPGGRIAAESVELGTISLVDLVGSTQIATSVGQVRWDEIRGRVFGLLREAINAPGGPVLRKTGDGLMVAFATAPATVCASSITSARRWP